MISAAQNMRIWPALLAVLTLGPQLAPAQMRAGFRGRINLIAPAAPPDVNAQRSTFHLVGESSEAADALADFNKAIEARAWEKAFRLLENLEALKPVTLIETSDGFRVPCDMQVRRLILALPAEGRQAFRIFYDARAKALLDARPDSPAEEIAALRQIHQRYLITTIGAAATDRLGDAYFERGEFARAARCWADILEYCPDAAAPVLRLRVKVATALARDGDWARFDDVARAVQARFPKATLTLGGREIVAADYLAELAYARLQSAPAAPARITLPRADEPLWRAEFLNAQARERIATTLQSQGLNSNTLASATISAATDGQRVMVNWLGMITAFEAASGKTLWQSTSFEVVLPRLQQFAAYGLLAASPICFHAGDPVRIGIEPNRFPSAQLASWRVQSGQLRWSTSNHATLSNYAFLGVPLIVGDVIYATALGAQKGELYLLAIEPQTGAPRWEVRLGLPSTTPRMGMNVDLEPRLVFDAGVVYVMTNDGMLIAVDAQEQRLRWGFVCGTGRRPFNLFRGRLGGATPPGQAGEIVVSHSVVYGKDRDGEELLAINAADMKLIARKPVDGGEAILGCDERNLYTLGGNLTAYDPATLQPRWWTSHFGQASAPPLMTASHIYIAGSRGLFEIEKTSGKVVGMFTEYEHAPQGGPVLLCGETLILVSDSAVTAYPAPKR